MIKKRFEKLSLRVDPDCVEICPIREILSTVSDKWSILIFFYLGEAKQLRFNQLKSSISGISPKILSDRLKKLEKEGYLSRKMFPEVPVRVEYQLTEFGTRYLNRVLDLVEWIVAEVPIVNDCPKN